MVGYDLVLNKFYIFFEIRWSIYKVGIYVDMLMYIVNDLNYEENFFLVCKYM